jgi:hypothetical protein
MYAHKHTIAMTCSVGGAFTGYTEALTGNVLAIYYVKTDFSDGSVMTVSGETTGETIWGETGVNASAVRRPRLPMHDSAGAGDAVAEAYVAVNERIKVVVSGGGNATTGTLIVVVG